MKNFSVTSFVLGIAVGLLLTSAWFFGSTYSNDSTTAASAILATSTPISTASGAISVENQSAGMVVMVESVTVPPPGVWVAVREVNGNTLGNVLGAMRVGGPRSTVSVPLMRATEPGRSYAVQLYRNDDTTDPFSLTTDSAYVDFDSGEPVVAYFTTTQ